MADRNENRNEGENNVGRTLLDRIVSSPDDDELRLVYADWLLERGDLQGELIQLQLRSPSLTRAETDRVVTLREAHESRWLGPVARVTRASDRIWARGFLVEATIDARRKQDLRAAMGHDAWALVRTIDAGGSAGSAKDVARPLVELLKGGGLRSLRSIKDANADVARGLLHQTSSDSSDSSDSMQAIDTLEIVLRRREDTDLVEEALAGHGLPNLRELTFSGWIRETRELALINTNVGRRVEIVTLFTAAPQLGDWISRLTNVPSFGRTLRVVKLRWLVSRPNHWTLTLKRDEDEAWSVLEVHGTADDARRYARGLALMIGELPPETLSRFAMYLTGETRFVLMYLAEVEQALGMQKRLTDENVTVPYDRAIARLGYED